MAVSKHTVRSNPDTNQRIQNIFRRSQVSAERKEAWHQAVQWAETGTPSLRFPVYEHLYFLNVYSQKLVDLVEEITGKFGIRPEQSLYHQSLIQQVRAGVTGDIVAHMHEIELTDEWLFGSLRREKERDFRDPDDIYIEVREREKERIKGGLAPRIRFLDEESAIKKGTGAAKRSS